MRIGEESMGQKKSIKCKTKLRNMFQNLSTPDICKHLLYYQQSRLK